MVEDFLGKGWCRFDHDAAVVNWVRHAGRAADHALKDPALAHWYDCENTWFIGVDALANDAKGRIESGPDLMGTQWAQFWVRHFGAVPPLHRGQLSAIWPGYPRPRTGEGPAAFRYRQKRFAAHVDGLLAVGETRQRMIREPHAFVVGMPLNDMPEDAAPLVLWEGSHVIMRRAFENALRQHDPRDWPNVDLTEPYKAARREVFETCPEIRVHARVGEAYLMHRHMLHGMAGWETGQGVRKVAYFRPEFPGGVTDWLTWP